ncbi:MAG: hypothetical protein HFP77_00240 [Methylococcales symbiont of Iophon sp. n. MRB-2018]|nr:MAG: hypothetical protein HFP77_00240 [Methylococcales symbiont of Iophon sp. n. MRB-2018]KAF3980762.1 MAG: hypothetical protein HFP76_00420 [Methylococcales symbiont of Iophon sp. n. MRB-2018]
MPLDEWDRYLDILCANRPYQTKAIKRAIIFLASGQCNTIADLIKENLNDNKQINIKGSE